MSVRKRTWVTQSGEPREAWVVDYIDQQGDRHVETYRQKKAADARHAEIKIDIKAGVHIAPNKTPTVREAGLDWIKSAENRGLERGTIKQYNEHLRLHIAPLIGNLKLSDISVAVVRAFEDKLRASGRSSKLTKMILRSLGAILSDAQERGLSTRNAVRDRGHNKRGDREKRNLKVGVDIPTPGHASITLTYDRYGHLFPRADDSQEIEQAELSVINATRMHHGG
jgi:integrase